MAISDLIKKLKTNVKAITSQYKKTYESKKLQESTAQRLAQITKPTTVPKPLISAVSQIKIPTIKAPEGTRLFSPTSQAQKVIESVPKKSVIGERVAQTILPTVPEPSQTPRGVLESIGRGFQTVQSSPAGKTALSTLKALDAIDTGLGLLAKKQPREEGESLSDYLQRVQQISDIAAENIGTKFGFGEKGKLTLALGLGLLTPSPSDVASFANKLSNKTLSKIASETSEEVIKKVLVDSGISEDVATKYAPDLAKASDASSVKGILKNLGTEATPKANQSVIDTRVKERGFTTSVKKQIPELQTKVSGQYIPRGTDDLSIKAKNLVKSDIASAEQMVKVGADDNAVATASELIKHYSDQASKATDKAVADALYQKAADVADTMAVKLTEAGRTVQAASILGRLTPEGQLKFAANEINKYNELIDKSKGGLFGLKKKVPNLTPDQTKSILEKAKKVQNMPDGIEKAREFQKLQNEISDLVPSSLYKKLIAVWRAGLLTGIKTTGLNTSSNLFHGVSEVVKDVPSAAVDRVSALFTGKRTLALTTRGISGVKEGFNKGVDYIKTGFDERGIGKKLDYNRVNFGNSKFAKGVQSYEETVFRVMGAEDQPFYYGAKAHSLYSQAIADAKNKGLKGAEYTKHIDDLVSNPTDDMLKYAANDAEIAVFQNQTLLGRAAKGFQQLPGGELIVPFGRTPAAVATQIINYSPVGIVKTIASNIGKGKFDQKLFSQGLGRGITGTGIIYLGTQLFKNGMVTLDYPDNERERKLWEVEGRKPNSIKVGGKYRDVNVLGPVGIVLIAGAYYQRALEESGSPMKAMTEALAGMGAALKEQTFLQGVKQVMDALDDPTRFAEGYVAGTLSSIIPTIFGDVAKAIDPFERRTEGFTGRLQAKVPGLRQELEPKITILGEKMKRVGNVMETLIDPSRPSKEIVTPVTYELRRLFDAGYTVTPTQLGDKNGYKSLSPEDNTHLWEDTGKVINKALGNLFLSSEYAKASDEKKADIIQRLVEESNNLARANMVLEKTQGLRGEELKNVLKQFYEDKLLTETVFKLYLKLR